MQAGQRVSLLATLVLVLAACVHAQSIHKTVAGAKVEAARAVHNATLAAIATTVQAHQTAVATKVEAHQALTKAVRAAFTPSPKPVAAPVPAPTPVVVPTSPTTPKQGLAERKAQTLADLAQAHRDAAKQFVAKHPWVG